jgi:uncharacterized protein (TIGR02453 family)
MWPPEAIEFLRELEDNNDRNWFRANRARYDELLLGPAHKVADTLDGFGKPHYFRPYNNLRFRPGPPLKEHIGVAIGYSGAGGYYFELSLDGLLVAAGLHRPATDQLQRFRAAINDGRRAKAFERTVTTAQDGGLELTAPAIKRAPRGYRPDHPRIDRLRLKSLVVSRRHALGSWLHRPTCGERIRSEFAASAPFVTWIGETVGPSHGSRS